MHCSTPTNKCIYQTLIKHVQDALSNTTIKCVITMPGDYYSYMHTIFTIVLLHEYYSTASVSRENICISQRFFSQRSHFASTITAHQRRQGQPRYVTTIPHSQFRLQNLTHSLLFRPSRQPDTNRYCYGKLALNFVMCLNTAYCLDTVSSARIRGIKATKAKGVVSQFRTCPDKPTVIPPDIFTWLQTSRNYEKYVNFDYTNYNWSNNISIHKGINVV